ncbi:MAG: aspartate carbamoyltransferase [Erysipelotrichaceae bacterium]|nr:aspartate carbamoyltransferase [Erysipelotrichaceae bacterium]
MRSVIDILDLSVEELDELIKCACDIIDHPEKYAKACEGKQLATLFYEPSTRTRMSFESAMHYLGGNVITMAGAANSSVSKGESVADTIRVVSGYVDIIAIRHPNEGAALVAADYTMVPVINGGDGGHFHPTQTLADLLTIYKEKGHLDNLTIGLCGDLKYGRTVHSLIAAMSRYSGIKFVLISPEELRCPEYVFDGKDRNNFEETVSLEEAMPKLDILYMTRIQKERFDCEETYMRLKDSYILTPDKLETAKKDMIVMHPLPRVNEISVAVDDDPRAVYIKQTLYGRYMRMALILKLLKEAEEGKEVKRDYGEVYVNKYFCKNPVCITQHEQELKHKAVIKNGRVKCLYCDHDID